MGKVDEEVGLMLGIIVSLWKMIHAVNETQCTPFLNILLLACTKSSIGSMRVDFLMALAGVPVRELFVYVGYWKRTRVPCAPQWAESAKKSDSGTTLEVLQVYFQRDVIQVDHPNHISN